MRFLTLLCSIGVILSAWAQIEEGLDIQKSNVTVNASTSSAIYKGYNSVTFSPGVTLTATGTNSVSAYITVPSYCVELKTELDAGYYTLKEGKLCIKFEEKYESNSNLVLKVFDYERNQLHSTTLATITGTNYFQITNLPSGVLQEGKFYLVELSTVKGELLKLRIKCKVS